MNKILFVWYGSKVDDREWVVLVGQNGARCGIGDCGGLQMRECFAVLNLCKKMMRGEKTKKLDKCGRCLFGWTECLDNDMPLIDSTQHVGI